MKELKSLFWTNELDRDGKVLRVEVFYDHGWLMRMAAKAAKAKGRKCCYGPVRAIARRPK